MGQIYMKNTQPFLLIGIFLVAVTCIFLLGGLWATVLYFGLKTEKKHPLASPELEERAQQAQKVNDLMQLALTCHNYADVHKGKSLNTLDELSNWAQSNFPGPTARLKNRPPPGSTFIVCGFTRVSVARC
jgi:hypothetical protein